MTTNSEGHTEGWQPIETAPKDGTDLLLAIHPFNNPSLGRMTVLGFWENGQWKPIRTWVCDKLYPPTHWMPLPPPPATGASDARG